MVDVLEKIENCENKLSTFSQQLEELDKSQTDNLSLLSELSIMIQEIDITDGKERRNLIDKMVTKITLDHDGKQHVVTLHYKLGLGDKKYKIL